jgi:hypothetical protein
VSRTERYQQQLDIPPLPPRPEYSDSLNYFREATNQLPVGTHGGNVIPAFSTTVLTAIDDTKGDFPEFRPFVEAYLGDRPEIEPSYAAKLFYNEFQYRALQFEVFKEHPEIYTQLLVSPYAWRGILKSLITPPGKRNEIAFHLAGSNVQATEPRRYAGLQIAIGSHVDYTNVLPKKPSLVDSGTSSGIGLVQLKEGIGFKDVRVHSDIPEVHDGIRKQLLGSVTLGKVVGFDEVMIDKGTLAWVESNSTYVEEFGDRERNRLRKFLSDKRGDIPIVWADLLDPDQLSSVRAESDTDDGMFDISSSLTSIYQLGDQQGAAQEALAGLARHITIVEDFAEIDNSDPTNLLFYKNINAREARYNLFIKYLTEHKKPIWHKLGSWGNSGRCHLFTPTDKLEDLYLGNTRQVS